MLKNSLTTRLVSLSEYQSAKIIAVYRAIKSEPDLADFIARATNDGKIICYPTGWKTGVMHMSAEDNQIIGPSKIDILIIPCVAYDPKTKVRLGRGGGHYDRYVEKCPNAFKILVANEQDAIKNLPQEPHDLIADLVITV